MNLRAYKSHRALVRRLDGSPPGALGLAERLVFVIAAAVADQPETASWAIRSVTDRVRRRINTAKAARRAQRRRVEMLAPPETGPSSHEQRNLIIAEQAIRAAKAGHGSLEEAVEMKRAALVAIERRQDMRWMSRHVSDLTQLERLRDGDLVVDEVVIDVPVLDEQGAPIWKRGRKRMRQERLLQPRLTNRDGLETLARSHLDKNGDVRKHKDGSPMLPAVDRLQLAAGLRYRGMYEAADPERILSPPDPSRMGRVPGSPFGDEAIRRMDARREQNIEIAGHEKAVFEAHGHIALQMLRAVAGKAQTVGSIATSGAAREKFTKALVAALDVLVDRFGLA